MTQTPPDLDRLHALAEAATQGEWRIEVDNVFAGPTSPDCVYVADCAPLGSPMDGHPATVANAAYIAAAQPSTVMWMIERIRGLERAVRSAALDDLAQNDADLL